MAIERDLGQSGRTASVDQTDARCASLKGGHQRSVARLSSGAKCRTAKPVRNRDGASGGNCTRSPGSAIICPQCGYDMVTEARPEMGREGAALHELVANSHSLTSFVRAKIVDLLRSG